jgi:hypothetical protein
MSQVASDILKVFETRQRLILGQLRLMQGLVFQPFLLASSLVTSWTPEIDALDAPVMCKHRIMPED